MYEKISHLINTLQQHHSMLMQKQSLLKQYSCFPSIKVFLGHHFCTVVTAATVLFHSCV